MEFPIYSGGFGAIETLPSGTSLLIQSIIDCFSSGLRFF